MTSAAGGGPGLALVRPPGPLLAEGIVTYLDREPVDLDLARRQHEAYCAALAGAGWMVEEVGPADECPDAVFIEDTVVVCDRLAVLTRPGAPVRRGEVPGVEAALHRAGLAVLRIEEPATLDGGDVLQVATTIYVGVGGRTNAAGVAALRALLRPRQRDVVAVPLGRVLHLKSAVTALPDGSVLLYAAQPDPDGAGTPPGRADAGAPVDASLFANVCMVAEEPGAHVVHLGQKRVLIAASAPRTAHQLRGLGWEPITVDIGEFEKLEGCVTCLSVLIPDLPAPAAPA